MPGQGAFAQSNAEDPRVPGTMLAEASTFDALPVSTEDVMLSQRVFMFSLGVLLPVLLFDFLFSGIGYGAYVRAPPPLRSPPACPPASSSPRRAPARR